MITILGASGFIGSQLARKLAAGGANYRAIGRNDPIPNENLGHVIYCIGVTADFRTRPLDTVEAHVCALIELIRGHQFESLLYLSSTRVYAGDDSSNEEKPLHVSPPNAPDLYNISKVMGESIVLNCAPNARVARLSNVYGPDFDSDNFLPSIVRDASGNTISEASARAMRCMRLKIPAPGFDRFTSRWPLRISLRRINA